MTLRPVLSSSCSFLDASFGASGSGLGIPCSQPVTNLWRALETLVRLDNPERGGPIISIFQTTGRVLFQDPSRPGSFWSCRIRIRAGSITRCPELRHFLPCKPPLIPGGFRKRGTLYMLRDLLVASLLSRLEPWSCKAGAAASPGLPRCVA